MLASEVIDRTFNNWLYPSGINRPTYDILATALDAQVTSKTIITSARQSNIPRDTILEIDSELILTQEVAGTTVTANERGYLDTVPASHAQYARILIDPMFSRKLVFDAMSTVIGDLYAQGVYRRLIDTSTVTWTTGGAAALPAGTLRLLKATLVRSSVNPVDYMRLRPERGEYEVLYEFEPPKIRMVSGGSAGAQVIVVVAKDFTLPALEADDLTTTCGVPAPLVPHLPLGVAGTILQSRELPRVMIEEIKSLLASQGVTVGAAFNVGQLLLRLFAQKVAEQVRRMAEADPTTVEFMG